MDEILSHSMDFGCPFMQSLPARGAWIEIVIYVDVADLRYVAPRKGSVD